VASVGDPVRVKVGVGEDQVPDGVTVGVKDNVGVLVKTIVEVTVGVGE
jgi:hypothetical protein